MGQDHQKTIDITVSYTGQEPYHEVVHGNPTFNEVKLKAMRAFGIEPSAAKKYVLQHNGTDLGDQQHVDALGQGTLALLLTLLKEPVKG